MTRLQASSILPAADTFEDRWNTWTALGRTRATRLRVRARVTFMVLVLLAGTAGLWLLARG